MGFEKRRFLKLEDSMYALSSVLGVEDASDTNSFQFELCVDVTVVDFVKDESKRI
jgi:hypothetical protein